MIDSFLFGISLIAFAASLIDTALGMCYGTILSPILLLEGYKPEVVVSTILISQLIADITGSLSHIKAKNFTRKDIKAALVVTIPAAIFVAFGAFSNVKLPKTVMQTYTGIVVAILGILLLLGIKFRKTTKRLAFISSIAGFNKGFMGGSFGPVIVPGQIVLDSNIRPSASIANISEIPVCAVGLFTLAMLGKLSFMPIYLFVTISAVLGSLIGPYLTVKVSEKRYATKGIGLLILILGLTTLFKIL